LATDSVTTAIVGPTMRRRHRLEGPDADRSSRRDGAVARHRVAAIGVGVDDVVHEVRARSDGGDEDEGDDEADGDHHAERRRGDGEKATRRFFGHCRSRVARSYTVTPGFRLAAGSEVTATELIARSP
jgi:hypothetical protein